MNRFLPCALLALAACGTNTEVESQLTITQGLYGQLTQACMGATCVGAPRVGSTVAWFDQNPYSTNDAGVRPSPVLEYTSGPNGFYEFPLESNTRGYLAIGELRTNGIQYFTSTSATIPRGLARIDWKAGGDEGTWTDVR